MAKKFAISSFIIFLFTYVIYAHLSSENTVIGDAYTFYIPNNLAVYKALKVDGELPLSDWHKGGGSIPLHERPNAPSLYLPNLVLFSLYPSGLLENQEKYSDYFQIIPAALHVFVSSLGMLLLLVSLMGKKSFPLATVLSLVWVVNPCFMSMVWFLPFVYMVSWLPWALWGILLCYKKIFGLGIITTAIAVFLALTSGYFSGIHYFFAGILLFAVSLHFAYGWNRKAALLQGASLVGGFFLSTYYILPLVHRLKNSSVLEQTGSIIQGSHLDFKPIVYLSILFRNFFGEYGVIGLPPEVHEKLFNLAWNKPFYEWEFYLGAFEVALVVFFLWRVKVGSHVHRFLVGLSLCVVLIFFFSVHVNYNGLMIFGFKLSKSLFGIHGKHRFFFVAQAFFVVILAVALSSLEKVEILKKYILGMIFVFLFSGSLMALSSQGTWQYQGNIVLGSLFILMLGYFTLWILPKEAKSIAMGLAVVVLLSRLDFAYARYLSLFEEMAGHSEVSNANLNWESSAFYLKFKKDLRLNEPWSTNSEFERNGFALFYCNDYNDLITPDVAVASNRQFEIGGYDLYRYFRKSERFQDITFNYGNLNPYWFAHNSVGLAAVPNKEPYNEIFKDSRARLLKLQFEEKTHNYHFARFPMKLSFFSLYPEYEVIEAPNYKNVPLKEELRMNAYRVLGRPLVLMTESYENELEMGLNRSVGSSANIPDVYMSLLFDGIREKDHGVWVEPRMEFNREFQLGSIFDKIEIIHYKVDSSKQAVLPIFGDKAKLDGLEVSWITNADNSIQFKVKNNGHSSILITEILLTKNGIPVFPLFDNWSRYQKENKDAKVHLTSNSAQFEIQSSQEQLVLTQLPYLNGYEIRTGDVYIQPLQVNYSKLGFLAKAGQHKYQITYRPFFPVFGFWASVVLATALVCAGIYFLIAKKPDLFNDLVNPLEIN